MKKYNIKKISSRQKFDMAPDELDQHILMMIENKAEEIDKELEEFRSMIDRLSSGIQNTKLREYIISASYPNTNSLKRAVFECLLPSKRR